MKPEDQAKRKCRGRPHFEPWLGEAITLLFFDPVGQIILIVVTIFVLCAIAEYC